MCDHSGCHIERCCFFCFASRFQNAVMLVSKRDRGRTSETNVLVIEFIYMLETAIIVMANSPSIK